jgi:thioredoxin-dependent peroxiredoxin
MTTELKPGSKAPAFTVDTLDGPARLKDFAGQKLVLFFYPKDDTPGCTQEALDFTAHAADFTQAGAALLGVSRDPLAKHEKFAAKHALTIRLASDVDGKVSESYGTWQEKSMYGRSFMGMVRRTFLIGPDARILRIWPQVKVKGHAAEVLAALKD